MMRRPLLPTFLLGALSLVQCGNPEVIRQPDVLEGMGGGGNTAGAPPLPETGGSTLEYPGVGGACDGLDCGGGGGVGGSTVEPQPYCGDSKIALGLETCDDGDAEGADGCSASCQREANYDCPTPGEACVLTVRCGDGAVAGDEQCDDGNDDASDGCSDLCQLENGWVCPNPGLRCVAKACGDSIVAGAEQCDDGDGVGEDGCSADCKLEEGFKCDAAGVDCSSTQCNDGLTEGTEQCDDGNLDLGDGCTPYCRREPDCSGGPCVSRCGDGILLGAELCDDGNSRSGDGCSGACEIESGFYCKQPPLAAQIEIPIVIRDVKAVDPEPEVEGTLADYAAPNHVDFELVTSEPTGQEDGRGTNKAIVRREQGATDTGRGKDLGLPGETFTIQHLDGSAIATVSLAGKPVYSLTREDCDKIAFPDNLNDWDKCTNTTMDADSFHSWFVDRDTANKPIAFPNFLARGDTLLKKLVLLRGAFDETTADFTAGGDAYTFDSRYMALDGTLPPVITGRTPRVRTPGFFPAEELGVTGTACSGEERNFHFTSEVRFWFQFDAANPPQLDFSGDDDVWVYVNGHLALDIGGIHARVARSFDLSTTNATAWGLEDGKVYEIAVFQTERNQCASNYWLTLRGFNAARSECSSLCGDGIIASDELCDSGKDNSTVVPPPYGVCGADCRTRGPNCGNGIVEADYEECDNGSNISVYDFDGKGCAPGCKTPPRCGDGIVQSNYEKCDDKINDGRYNGCTKECQVGPRCGDSITQTDHGEQCDDGPRGSGKCSAWCTRTTVE